MYFWIIKCVDLELILFAINLDVASSSKVLTLLIMCFYQLYYQLEPINLSIF